MAAVIDLAKFAFTKEELTSVKDLVYEGILQSPELALFCTIHEGIKFNKDVGFVGPGGLVGKAGQGCNPTAQSWNIVTRKITWAPADWEVFLKHCYKDLETTIGIYSLKTGIQRADFTSSDYMAIIVDFLIEGIKDMMLRLAFFGDTAADVIANGGKLTAGTDKDFFTLIDGFFKQITVAYTANAKQRVTISENAGANYAAQALVEANVQGYLKSLTAKASPLLKQMDGNIIICTQSFYEAYKGSLQGTSIESMYVNLVTGVKTLSYDGKPLIPVPEFDALIEAYYDNGTKLDNPHRAIYTNPGVLAVGVDEMGNFAEVDVWYDKTDRNVYSLSTGKIDAKLADPKLVQIAI